MECNTFEELLYRDLLIADSMEKNTLKEFPSEERKVLMQLLFPLKDKERFCYLYQDMTLEQYTAKVVTKVNRLAFDEIVGFRHIPLWQRDLAAAVRPRRDRQYLRRGGGALRGVEGRRGPAQRPQGRGGVVLKNTFVPLDKQSKKAQRAAVRANRALWQGVKLCPRIMRKKTDYRRKGRRVDALDT